MAADPADLGNPQGFVGVRLAEIDAPNAISVCRAAVETNPGNARLAYQLGRAFARAGRFAEAEHWYRRAAVRGYASARYWLGFTRYIGRGRKRNLAEAAHWFRLAANQGHARAQYQLGVMFYRGEGVARDFHAAVGWFRRAADQGVAHAQTALGMMYEHGRAVPRDYVEAYRWYDVAAAQGNEIALHWRDRVRQYMSERQISDGQRLAHQWRLTHLGGN